MAGANDSAFRPDSPSPCPALRAKGIDSRAFLRYDVTQWSPRRPASKRQSRSYTLSAGVGALARRGSDQCRELGWRYRAKSIAFNAALLFTQRRYEMELGTSQRCGRGAPSVWRLPGYGVRYTPQPNQDVRSDRSRSACCAASSRLLSISRSAPFRWLGVFIWSAVNSRSSCPLFPAYGSRIYSRARLGRFSSAASARY